MRFNHNRGIQIRKMNLIALMLLAFIVEVIIAIALATLL